MATTSENLRVAQLRLKIIAKEQTVKLLAERIEFLKIEILTMYEEVRCIQTFAELEEHDEV